MAADKPNPIDGMTVVLEDHGQDFLEFDIQDGRIRETRPFQGFVWDGRKVVNKTIVVGDRITLRMPDGVRNILYPVVAVRPLGPIRIGPDDV